MPEAKPKNKEYSNSAYRDLLFIILINILVFVFSYFFNIFSFLAEVFSKYPRALTYIDEIITVLITLALSMAVFSLRRWQELKRETAMRIRAQEELIRIANTKAETERIINKQLESEIEVRKRSGNYR